MITIRPHHLLCMQSFRGKGYSPSFVEAMTVIIKELREDPKQKVLLQISFDSICEACPRKEGACKESHSVVAMDQKVIELFHLAEGSIIYEDALAKVYSQFTEVEHEKICRHCSWYKQGYCRKELQEYAEFFKSSASMI